MLEQAVNKVERVIEQRIEPASGNVGGRELGQELVRGHRRADIWIGVC